jgi:hypothetical protein
MGAEITDIKQRSAVALLHSRLVALSFHPSPLLSSELAPCRIETIAELPICRRLFRHLVPTLIYIWSRPTMPIMIK